MGARAILTEMRDLLRAQTRAVAARDHQAVVDAANRHEQMLTELETAEIDAAPDELRALASEISTEKERLKKHLTLEAARVDFLLRLIFGGGKSRPAGYPDRSWQADGKSRRLNRQT